MKKKDLPRLEREVQHYSSTYRYANQEGKEQLALHIWKLRQAITEHSQGVAEEPPEITPQLPYCPNCGTSADSLEDRSCGNCEATIPI